MSSTLTNLSEGELGTDDIITYADVHGVYPDARNNEAGADDPA